MVSTKEAWKRAIVISLSFLPFIMFLSFRVRVFIMHYIGMLPVWILRLNYYLINFRGSGTIIYQGTFIIGILASIGIIILALSCIFGVSRTKVRWNARFWAIVFGCLCAVFASWDITYPDGEELVKALMNGGDEFEYAPAMFIVYKRLWLLFHITGFIFGYCLVWSLYRIGKRVFFSLSSDKKQDEIVSSQKDNSTQ